MDVGGKVIRTTKATLTKDPTSMLARLFGGSEWSEQQSEVYRLDCDHRYFRVILNYLRHNELILEDNLSKRGILVLARYLQIQQLIALLEPFYGDSTEWSTVLEDDFSTPIDEKKWTVDTSRKEAKINDNIYGQLVLINRAALISVQQYPPRVKITGQWKFSDQEDSLHIFTRCDGQFGENGRTMETGIEFFSMKQNNFVLGRGNVPKIQGSLQRTTNGNFKLVANKFYGFEVIDAITTVQFLMYDYENPEINVKVTGTLEPENSTHGQANHIAFYNRERTGGAMVSTLADIKIQQWVSYKQQEPRF
uniref:BTB domain-containing protein n=1 Tax=Arcella intermedia TaxID=1963864 RepID=A0A6B2LAZ8_9EUKA